MNTSQFMDKQIMDLSNSQGNNSNDDFINLMNPREDNHVAGVHKKEEILPSYDFQPIRPIGPSSPPSKVDSSNIAAPRAWNSADNKSDVNSIRNYSSFNSFEPAKVILEKDRNTVDPILISEIDHTVKKYADNLLHALDGISARLSQLESRTRHLENSVDDLKVSVGNNYGSSDGRMRQVENILREVQDGVQVVRDKQEILDAHLQLAKLQVSKVEQHSDNQTTEHVDSSQPAISAAQQSHQQLPPLPLTQQPPMFHNNLQLPNAPPPPSSQQNLLPQVQPQNQFPQNPIPSVPQREPYFPSSSQSPEALGQSYQLPPPQQIQPSSQVPPQQQYQSPPQPQYSQPPPPSPPQQHPPPSASNPPHHHEELPYVQPQSYPPNIRPPSLPPSAAPPPPQFYGTPALNMYEPPSNRPSPGFSAPYGPSSGSPEPYPYSSSPSQYGSSSPMKPQQISSAAMSHSSGSSYPQLPTARILPQALPTASGIAGGSGSGNRVPIDDVVDKVTSMGFSRDQVRATVRRLTENGQSVDLNVVLDKLMNDGEGQPPRGWFGR